MRRTGAQELGTEGANAYGAIVELCSGTLAPLVLLERVAERVRSVVPYAAAGWLLTDPATMLHTGAFSEDVPRRLHAALMENEIGEPDVGKFTHVARLPQPVLRLHDAVGGDVTRSARHRRLYAPSGYGAELRAAFRTRAMCWGLACLTRAEGEPEFGEAEVAFVAAIGAHVAHGLRTAHLVDAGTGEYAAGAPRAMVVLGEDGAVESMSGDAERWLTELPAGGLELPVVVHQVARRARARALGDAGGSPASARVRLPSGSWMLVHAAVLRPAAGTASGARIAVILEPARAAVLAPLIVELHDLTEREREVVMLLLRGLSIDEIARSLWITQQTLRDHVKAIYAKLHVSSRAQLMAKLSYEPMPSA